MKKIMLLFALFISLLLVWCSNKNSQIQEDDYWVDAPEVLEENIQEEPEIIEEPIIEIIEEPEIDLENEDIDYTTYIDDWNDTSRIIFVWNAKANETKEMRAYWCPAGKQWIVVNWWDWETDEIKNAWYDACAEPIHTYAEAWTYVVSIWNINNLEAIQINNMNVKAIRINRAPKLRVINLNLNSIKTIDKNTFNNLPSLNSLSIAANKIDNFSWVFINLWTLKELNINDNSYKTVNSWFFLGLKNIEEIDVCNNRNLRVVETEAFKWLNSLKILNIYNNENLKIIEKDAFIWLDLLREINLSNNSISSLPEWIFSNKDNLRDYYRNDTHWDYFFTIEWISVNGNCLKKSELDEETITILNKVASPNRAKSQKDC